MKRKLLLPVLALTALLGTLLSCCSSDSGTASLKIPVTQIFRNVEKDILPSDKNEINLEITLSGDAKDSLTFNWKEKEQNCTFENLPVGGVVSVSAKVKDGEDLIYSGESDKIKLKNEPNETTITMQKLMSRLTVKTDSTEISKLQESSRKILITVTDGKDFRNTWETTPQEFSKGHEIKYLPTNKELTVTVEARTKDTAIFRGKTTKTITEDDQKPECTIVMERVKGDETSVEIRTLPTPELKAISTNGNTFSLTQDTEPPVACFSIYYTDSSTEQSTPKLLPDWVTYKWKMNGIEFTPNDNSGQATLGMDEKTEGLKLTIYLNKMQSILPPKSDSPSQNSLYVEIGMKNSEETKSTTIEFTITQ